MKNGINPIFIIFIIILTGTVILVFSLVSKDKTKDYIETTAKFYNSEKKITGDNNYKLIYKYTVNGKEYEFSQDVTSKGKPLISRDDTIKIKYNPENPRQALLYNESPKLGGIIFGAILIIVGVITFIKIRGA